MANIRRYQPRRSSSANGGSIRWLIIIGSVVVVGLVWKFAFSGHPKTAKNESTVNSNSGISLVTDNSNVAITSTVTTTNGNTNTNTPAATTNGSWKGFSVKQCPNAISTFGTKKRVVLTLALSAANDQITPVVDVLKKAGVVADFFASGSFAAKNPAVVKSVADAGFAVYSQSYDSTSLTSVTEAGVTSAITKAETAIVQATGVSPKPIFRPPAGDYNDKVLSVLQTQGYCAVLWTVDAYDWQDGMTAAQSQDRIMTALGKQSGGSIIALHAGYDITAELVTNLIATLRSSGTDIVTLATLLNS